jgi:hypothetical protein
LAEGICPADYVRYRIDDHIEDIFNLLGILGEHRTFYLPEVVFEHSNFVENSHGVRQYFSDEEILALDAPRFEALFAARKELALRLKKHLAPLASQAEIANWWDRLEAVEDSFALRVPGRQLVVASVGYRFRTQMRTGVRILNAGVERIMACIRTKGFRGLVNAVWKRTPLARSGKN